MCYCCSSSWAAMSADQYLRGVRAVILEPGLGKGRTRILCKQLERRGGSVEPSVCASTSHLLVGGNVRRSRLPVLLGGAEVPAGVRVVRADWLSACLTRGERLREEDFEVPQETLSKTPPTSAGSSPSKAGTGAEGVKDSPVKCAAKEEAGEGRVGEVAVGGAGEGGVGGAVEGGAGEGVESCDEDQQPAIERVSSGLHPIYPLLASTSISHGSNGRSLSLPSVPHVITTLASHAH